MNAQQLKNSILQMAVQGKLVPQDPNDEPASVLLERIRKEKEKLIKEGKIKKEKNPSYIFRGADNLPYEKIVKNEPVCIADEVPFEIPDNWEWVRLISICTKLVDGDHNPPKGVDKKTNYIMASSTNINNDTLVELEKVRYLTKEVYLKENERTCASKGDIFFTSVGSIGRSCIFDGSLDICFQRSVSVITTLIYNCYLKIVFDSAFFQTKVITEATGTAQKGFYLNQLASSLIPVPPMNEQLRIVSEINKYLPYISEYDAKKQKFDNLNETFPETLKKSILQQAVMGKLVPQNPNDESASVLLEKIQTEKTALIKAGKLKKEKHESIIYRMENSHYEKLDGVERCIDDEIPFEIPESWGWARLRTISTKLVDGDHNPPKGVDIKTNFIMASSTNINNDSLVDLEKVRYLTEDVFLKENERTNATAGDIFFTSVGSLGRSCIFDGTIHICFQRSVSVISTLVFNKYLKIVLDCPYVQAKVTKEATGTAQRGFYLNQLAELLIPLPPIEEQKRIVERLESILSYCNLLAG